MSGFPPSVPFSRGPRLLGWLIATVVIMLALAFVAPEQMPVIAYKLGLVTLGCVLAYWLDRALFPYARPHACIPTPDAPGGCAIPSEDERKRYEFLFAAACIRRALIVLACVLGLTLGL